jgi:putative ABC transport system permease protein
MKLLLKLAWKSLKNRKISSLLAILSMALSCALVLGVSRLGRGIQSSFSNTISQTDLIVGARGGSLELLLYTVFHMGQATNNVRMSSYQHFAEHPAVEWTVPISLGDSYRGHRVVATTHDLFERYRFRRDRKIEFSQGHPMKNTLDVVLGAEVARLHKHKIGDSLVLSHGLGKTQISALYEHSDKPFQVVGILKRTGTPLDHSLYITLEGMEALHIDWQDGAPPRAGESISIEQIDPQRLQAQQITAFFVGAKSRIAVLHLQREIATFSREPLTAVIPGLALSELWKQLSYIEDTLFFISLVVLVLAFIGILLSLFSSLQERRRELALLRVSGARPRHILMLLIYECLFLTSLGFSIGLGLAWISQWALAPWVESEFGVAISLQLLSWQEFQIGILLILASPFVGLWPAWRAYKQSLSYDLIQRS